MSPECTSPSSSPGHNVKPLDVELQNEPTSAFGRATFRSGHSPPDQSVAFSLHQAIIGFILCAVIGAVGTFCCMIVGHSILQPYMSGFYVSIHSTTKVGAVGGAIVNVLLLPIMISLAASQPTVTSPICLALLTAGYPMTIASSCAGVVILRHIPGGTLDVPQAICAAAVGYSVFTFPTMLVTIYFVIQGCRS